MIPEMVDLKRLRIPVEKDQPICCYSQAKQDLFVVAVTHGQSHGTWLEIGCYLPEFINNTCMLEKDFGWSGYSIDIDHRLESQWKVSRPLSTFIGGSVFDIDWDTMPKYFDYVQVDIDPVEHNLTILEILLEKIKFKILTFEHDFFTGSVESQQVRTHSRKLLQSAGYQLVASDVTILPTDGRPTNSNPMWFEDWWVDPSMIDSTTIQAYKNVDQTLQPKYWQTILL